MTSLSKHGWITRAVTHTGRMGNVSLEGSTRKCEVQGVLAESKELDGELDPLVQMRFEDVPVRDCREGRERPELAAVAGWS